MSAASEKTSVYEKPAKYEEHSAPPSEVSALEEDISCGYCCWRPAWLQDFNSPRFLLACVSWFTFTQGFVVNGVIYTNFTSWERRYGFSSTQLAWVGSSYDVAAALFTITFGYIGQWMHNGKILCIGAYMMSVGSFIMTLPHFISGEYVLGPKPVEICDLSENQTDVACGESETSYYSFFLVAQCLHGIGGAAVYTLAIPYMDDQVKIKNTPLYIGIMQGFAALGPALGFILGGLFINIYVDINEDVEVDITPSDPRWVGAWWIGLLYSGFAALTVGFLIGCFPKELPSGRKYRAERKSEAYKSTGVTAMARADYGKSLADIGSIVKDTFTNIPWIMLTIAGTIESGVIIGFATFLPKIMQFQFAQPPARAAAFAGLVVVPGAAGGQIIGGLIPKMMGLRMRGLVMQSLICSVLAIGLSCAFLMRCDTIPIAGVTVPYFNNSMDDLNVVHPCNSQCNCTTESYDPVCGSDNIEYFTPCHGGCTATQEDGDQVVYNNCSCIGNTNPANGFAESGICASDCNIFGIFLVLFFFMCLVTFISATSGQAASIRCVPDKQRAFAFGIQRTIVRLCGNVPGAIAIGAVFDTACILMQENCDGSGSCWIYDTGFISRGIVWTGVIVKSVSSLCFLVTYIIYRSSPQEQEMDQITLDISTEEKSKVDTNHLGYLNDVTSKTYM